MDKEIYNLQLDSFWKENIETNSNIQMLSRCGRTWRDLNLSCIQGLPTLKERDLKRRQEQEEQDRLVREEKAKLEADKHYYEKNFEKIMLDKIDNKENLTESELKRLIYDYRVDTDYGDDFRWQKQVFTVVQLYNRTFMIEWMQGLTEYQDNSYDYQPYEVEKISYEKTITVTEWETKER